MNRTRRRRALSSWISVLLVSRGEFAVYGGPVREATRSSVRDPYSKSRAIFLPRIRNNHDDHDALSHDFRVIGGKFLGGRSTRG